MNPWSSCCVYVVMTVELLWFQAKKKKRVLTFSDIRDNPTAKFSWNSHPSLIFAKAEGADIALVGEEGPSSFPCTLGMRKLNGQTPFWKAVHIWI